MNLRQSSRRHDWKTAERRAAHDRAKRLFAAMRPDQIAFADHLISSWGARAWPTGKTFGCTGNLHVPIVQLAIRVAVERRP